MKQIYWKLTDCNILFPQLDYTFCNCHIALLSPQISIHLPKDCYFLDFPISTPTISKKEANLMRKQFCVIYAHKLFVKNIESLHDQKVFNDLAFNYY